MFRSDEKLDQVLQINKVGPYKIANRTSLIKEALVYAAPLGY